MTGSWIAKIVLHLAFSSALKQLFCRKRGGHSLLGTTTGFALNSDLLAVQGSLQALDNGKYLAMINQILGRRHSFFSFFLPNYYSAIIIQPTSCSQLNQMGQKVNGFYTIKNNAFGRTLLQTVFCDFSAMQVGLIIIIF